jgi:hypothetical protein
VPPTTCCLSPSKAFVLPFFFPAIGCCCAYATAERMYLQQATEREMILFCPGPGWDRCGGHRRVGMERRGIAT